MIQLQHLGFEYTHLGRLWDLSSHFALENTKVTLLERFLDSRTVDPNDGGVTSEDHAHRSRSHSGNFTIEITASVRCGVDLEAARDADESWSIESPMFQKAILAHGEYEQVLQSRHVMHPYLETLIWSSKEALSKALGDATNYEPSQFASPLTWPDGKSARWQALHLDLLTETGEMFVVWVVIEKTFSTNQEH
jgi:phosphopantetheinyl transferase